MRVSDYAPNIEKSYLAWINRFLLFLFHSKKHPCDGGEIELASFLEHFAINRKVSRATLGPHSSTATGSDRTHKRLDALAKDSPCSIGYRTYTTPPGRSDSGQTDSAILPAP
ncbi:MAG: phage integrase N-terminal SAM-like domain-containing protein [Candidatus Thiodiazotropha sp.]